jgi:diguanylate cyclase (GGDEF)-like protein
MENGVVAPLHGESGCVGLFSISGRESVDRNFTDEDLRLLETLTGNVTVALQYDRLEQAVRELESLQQELERKALYDSLTQLANRSLFHNRLEHALHSRRPGVCVLLLDIDEFKAVNDSHGHHAGDELLRAVADRLRGCLREGDTAARLGGDEFALLLDRSGGEVDAVTVARRLLTDFESRIEVGGERVRVHVSIGVAIGSPGKDGPDEMLRKADVALYEAKRRGKNQYRIFHPSMRDALRKRRTLAYELERAVSDEELTVVYQPIVSLTECRPTALEALVRWNHPERGLMPPAEFIAFAEETGAVVEIGASCSSASWKRRRGSGSDPRQRLRARAGRPRLPRQARRAGGHPPAAARAAGVRAHRARLRGRRPGAARGARGAPRARHGRGGGRLRHRLLVARLPLTTSRRHHEDPEAVHRRGHGLPRAPRAGARGDRAGRRARPQGDRRRHRDS